MNESELYTDPSKYNTISLTNPLNTSLDVVTFAGNMLQLQGIKVSVLGSNTPLWSLAYEWWYYIIFLFAGMVCLSSKKIRYIAATATFIIISLLPYKVLLWGSIWLLGLAAYKWSESQFLRPKPLLAIIIFLIALGISRLSHNTENTLIQESVMLEFIRDFALGVAFSICLISMRMIKDEFVFYDLHRRLAELSYTAYLTHFPLMIFVCAFLAQAYGIPVRQQPDFIGLSYFFSLSFILIAYSFIFWYLTERNTKKIRKWMSGFLSKNANAL